MNSVISVLVLNVLLVFKLSNATVHLESTNGAPAFDQSLYENVLDPVLCQRQLEIARNNTLLWLQFIESGLRIPRSITTGNLVDLGNFHQCLGIDEDIDDTKIEGKYCTISVPANQEIDLPSLPEWPPIDLPEWPPIDLPDWLNITDGIDLPEWINNPRKLRFKLGKSTQSRINDVNSRNIQLFHRLGRSAVSDSFGNIKFKLAVCIPKACTVREGLTGLTFNLTAIGFQYEENSCRLRNDKHWVPADYVAICIFSLIGLLTILSTSYDIYFTKILKYDPKSLNTLYKSFSVYTNGHRLTTFTKIPGTLECLDGIRAIAMIWVIVGHTFFTLPAIMNQLDSLDWSLSFRSFWITSAPISVDTFFLLSGLLVVYTTANKLTGKKLLQNLHLFYLNRILRMFPLLAAAVLFQASIMHRISDGPQWDAVAASTEHCRRNWWTTLLYIQNIVNPGEICIGLTWYLAIDMQLHIISPIVLFFVLGRKKNVAWSVLVGSFLAVITAATIYIFSLEMQSGVINGNPRLEDGRSYFQEYYVNTLARASPFFVGMIFGYIIHLYREEKLIIPKLSALLLWISAFALTSLSVYSSEPMKSTDWDNQTVDSLVNSFSRPAWALGLGWIIVACVQGYGGPINWFLCLQMWKLPARISYAMYLFHMMFMVSISGSYLAPIYFSQISCLYKFCAHLTIALLVGFFVTLLIDSPFSTLFKLLMGGGPKRPPPEKEMQGKQEIDRL